MFQHNSASGKYQPNTAGPKPLGTTNADKVQFFDMGTFLGAAVMSNASSKMSKADVDNFYKWGTDIAKKYKVPVAPLPAKTSVEVTNLRNAVLWCSKGLAPTYVALDSKYGQKEEDIFEFAIKLHLLRTFYYPGEDAATWINDAIKTIAPRNFPATIWKPVTDGIDNKLPRPEVLQRINDCEKAARAHYAGN